MLEVCVEITSFSKGSTKMPCIQVASAVEIVSKLTIDRVL